jgi:hypothetical protein
MKRVLVALAFCILSSAAAAQTALPPAGGGMRMERMLQQLQTRFANANTTHDGKLTREQAASGMPMVAQHFDEIDTQKMGFVTLPQIEAFMKQRVASR